MNILVVEDEISLADSLAEILKRNKFSVDTVFDGEDGMTYCRSDIYDCIILDVMLPYHDGYEIVRTMRREGVSTPVLMLTAKSDIEDKIHGLDCGADDYLTKPFATEELLARVRALTRRKGEMSLDVLEFGDLQLDLQSYSLVRGEKRMHLSLKEYQIMQMLMNNPKQILSKERLIEKIWGFETNVEYNSIEVYVSFLRKKMRAMNTNVYINTARGIGYSLEQRL